MTTILITLTCDDASGLAALARRVASRPATIGILIIAGGISAFLASITHSLIQLVPPAGLALSSAGFMDFLYLSRLYELGTGAVLLMAAGGPGRGTPDPRVGWHASPDPQDRFQVGNVRLFETFRPSAPYRWD